MRLDVYACVRALCNDVLCLGAAGQVSGVPGPVTLYFQDFSVSVSVGLPGYQCSYLAIPFSLPFCPRV